MPLPKIVRSSTNIFNKVPIRTVLIIPFVVQIVGAVSLLGYLSFRKGQQEVYSTITILKYRLKASNSRPEIAIIKHYGDLPQVECYAGQLNQVFMNLLVNAIDALDESNQGRSYAEITNQITIKTE